MDSDRVLNTDTSRLNFMYNRIFMSRARLSIWLQIPYFVDAINTLLDNGITVTNRNVLEICERVLADTRLNDNEFRLKYSRSLRQSFNRLKRFVESETQTRNDIARLDFLYNKISMPKVCINAWLLVPEFVDAVSSLIDMRIEVTDENIFKICNDILGKAETSNGNAEMHKKLNNISFLQRGVTSLKRALDASTKSASAPESERTSS